MRQKDPYENSHEERYGRHSNFRPQRDGEDKGFPIMKWLLVVFAMAFAVLGYDRLRGRGHAPAAAHTTQPTQELPNPPPVAHTEEKPVPQEEAPRTEMPVESPAALPAKVAEESPPPTPAEKPETTARYEMTMNRSNSFVGQGAINGKDVTLLADTGASMVVVPEKVAQRLGLKKGATLAFKTGGGVVPHYATTIDKLRLGQIEMSNIEAAINPAMQEDFVLLGMSALRFVDMERDTGQGKLVLKHKQAHAAGPGDLRTVEEESFKRSVKDCKGQGNKFDQQTLDCLRGN